MTHRLPATSFANASLLLLLALSGSTQAADPPPNLVVILADDLGYGDLGCFGHPTIRTPHLDRMAAEGMRLTSFYSGAPVCTPSRAALLTGRLPVRSGMASPKRRVLFPDSAGGLPAAEVTIAEALREQGYATACIGKWHLGHLPEHLPNRHGFDTNFGLPYSNDMKPAPLLRDGEVVEEPAEQATLTRRYTDEALRFLRENQRRPFFLYLAHTFPHVPLHASDEFRGRSLRGLYGDVVEELDHHVGRLLNGLRELGLERRTLVLFTSDNGPWLVQRERGGSAGLLREGKGSTWEGGVRVPAIAWWPGKVRAGSTSTAITSALDVFPTALELAGLPLPHDRALDGFSLLPVLLERGPAPRNHLFYYRDSSLFAVREGPWKAHFFTQAGYGEKGPTWHDPPLLFHLEHDPSEAHNVALRHLDVVERLRALADAHREDVDPGPPQLEARIAAARPAGGDWPMLAHDPARSGTTAFELRPPFERKWHRFFADEGLMAGVQPVVAAGRVFIGSLAGILHAIDSETGRDLWTFRAGGAVLHAAAVADARVFFGAADGRLYALDAARGTLLWRF
jgi:arylsulfatase A-like enzyme